MRRRQIQSFGVGQGNDALKAPHHTRVEGDRTFKSLGNPSKRLLLLENADSLAVAKAF